MTVDDRGTGQGSVIPPLLANIYLDHCFDLWVERWRRREAQGDTIVVRYADDLAVGFEHEGDAHRFLDAMREGWGICVVAPPGQDPPDSVAALRRSTASDAGSANRRPLRSWASPSSAEITPGILPLHWKTRRDRMRARLKDIKAELRRRMHDLSLPRACG